MLIQSTFLHLNKFGKKIESTLWSKNILTWNDYIALEQSGNLFFDKSLSVLGDSFKALESKDLDFFAKKLPKSSYFRLALSFPEDVMFLDIETTGLSRFYDHITMIGWSVGSTYGYYVNGISDNNEFIDAISRAKVLVTFNGGIFDIPFIKSMFNDIKVPDCHIDLRFFAKSVGLDGGQKKIEEFIGVKRPYGLKNTDGFQATVLWDQYKWGDKKSLLKLIQYNHADVEGMKSILDYCIAYSYKHNGYKKYFKTPLKFSKFKSNIDKEKIRRFVFDNDIPFDPKSTLKYKELASKIGGKIKIIGIDLTGSETKASGVAVLEDNKVETLLIASDDEMIDFIVNKKPVLVSIDSPLSLPHGRTSVFDDDPGRDEFGIMRICERVLKKRGVNAYPTLLPSMQKLTKRGIEIADRLRKLGIPVIESYPGVIQDIIGLPRKQASLSLLKKGLGIFGLKGSFLKENVSHDEVDAITSAIVGLFFLSGDYEPIGDLRENFMIIPNLNAEHKKKLVIGVSGQIAAGKTTASMFIEKEFGFKYARYSQVLKNILQERGETPNRASLQKLGYEMSQRQTELSKLVYSNVKNDDFIVIDGLRHLEDYAFFFEMFGYSFKLLYIEAPEKDKKKRYIDNGAAVEEYSIAISNEAEQDVPRLKDLATVKINNNKDISSMNHKVGDLVTKWSV